MVKLGEFNLNHIYTGDARALTNNIPDNSIDLIFTDPPYQHEFLPLYSWLSKEAARILKPGCLCLAYAGKTAFTEVISRLSEHLDYYWLFDIYEPGTGASLWAWKLWGNHRPILAFSKGKHSRDRWLHDAIKGSGRDKRYHHWGQSQKDAEYFIYSLTDEDSLVLDPFCGGGTVPAACIAVGCNFLAFEIDPQAAKTAKDRIKHQQPPLFTTRESVQQKVLDDLFI